MSVFLLNDKEEILLEIDDDISLYDGLFLEINLKSNEALLKNKNQKIDIGYVHPEVMSCLKKNRYLFVIKRSDKCFALNYKQVDVLFVD